MKNITKALSIMTLVILLPNLLAQECRLSEEVRKQVDDSIFQIVPINSYAAELKVERAREIYRKECSVKSPLPHQRLNCQIFKTCLGKSCARKFSPHGTAFLGPHGDELLTAWHVVFSTHAAALYFLKNHLENLTREERRRTLSSLRPEFVLIDQKGSIVFDTRDQIKDATLYKDFGEPLSTIYSSIGTKKDKAYGFFENIPGDYALISLPKRIGSGLSKGKRPIKNQCLFSLGHSFDGRKTKYQESAGKPTTILNLQKMLNHFIPFQLKPLPTTEDKLLKKSTSEILKIMGYSSREIRDFIRRYSDTTLRNAIRTIIHAQKRNMRDQKLTSNSKALFFTAKVLPGQSGAPVINIKGEVIGITTNGFIHKVNQANQSVGASAFLLETLEL